MWAALIACVAAPSEPWEAPEVDEWAPTLESPRPAPPGAIAISVTGLAPTETATITVTGLSPGDSVAVATSPNGLLPGGFCPPTLGGVCLDLSLPVGKVGNAIADAAGVAMMPWTVPLMVSPGTAMGFQAVYIDGADSVVSPAIEVVASESACPTNGVISAPVCPAACTGGCDDGTCRILCNDTSECQVTTLTCPDDMNCHVICSGLSSCQVSTINCPDGGFCEIDCSFTSTCQVADIVGGDGGLHLECDGTSACQLAEVTCGSGPCLLECDGIGASISTHDCGASCDCDPGDC